MGRRPIAECHARHETIRGDDAPTVTDTDTLMILRDDFDGADAVLAMRP